MIRKVDRGGEVGVGVGEGVLMGGVSSSEESLGYGCR